jgi:hypothetical protein
VRYAKCGADNREAANSAANAVLRLLPSASDAAQPAEPSEQSVSEKIVVRLMKFPLPSSFRRPLLTASPTIRTL